jgi:hypothetical protein
VLRNAAKDIKFAFVDHAFGGQGISDKTIRAEEKALRERQEDIDPSVDEGPVRDAELVSTSARESGDQDEVVSSSANANESGSVAVESADEDNEDEEDEDEHEDEDDTDGDVDSDDEAEDDDDDDSDDVDEEGLQRTRSGHMLWRSDFSRSRYRRWKVERDVPCAPHTRVYTGHCNVKTVKDVNYFGLQDEYVVSGSDSGHVFIWDRKTAELVNILEGDGEVVNVIQGKSSIYEYSWREASLTCYQQVTPTNLQWRFPVSIIPSRSSLQTPISNVMHAKVSVCTPQIQVPSLVSISAVDSVIAQPNPPLPPTPRMKVNLQSTTPLATAMTKLHLVD